MRQASHAHFSLGRRGKKGAHNRLRRSHHSRVPSRLESGPRSELVRSTRPRAKLMGHPNRPNVPSQIRQRLATREASTNRGVVAAKGNAYLRDRVALKSGDVHHDLPRAGYGSRPPRSQNGTIRKAQCLLRRRDQIDDSGRHAAAPAGRSACRSVARKRRIALSRSGTSRPRKWCSAGHGSTAG